MMGDDEIEEVSVLSGVVISSVDDETEEVLAVV